MEIYIRRSNEGTYKKEKKDVETNPSIYSNLTSTSISNNINIKTSINNSEFEFTDNNHSFEEDQKVTMNILMKVPVKSCSACQITTGMISPLNLVGHQRMKI